MILSALLATSCSAIVGETPVAEAPTSSSPPGTTTTTSTLPEPERCLRITQSSQHIGSGEASADALHLSGETFVCANDVVVVSGNDITELALAAQLAAALTGPLLLPHAQLAAEIGRLKPARVHLIGEVEVTTPPTADLVRHDLASAADLVKESLDTDLSAQLPESHASVVVGAVTAIMGGDRVAVPAPPDPAPNTTSSPATTAASQSPSVYDPVAVIAGLAVANGAETAWLVDAADPVGILVAAVYAEQVEAAVVAVTATDLLGHPEVSTALAGKKLDSIRAVGGLPEPDPWELSVLLNGVEVPGGGFRILPADQKRRYVAFYGHPETAALGALGEQGPEETLLRMQPFLDAYTGDGSQVVPVFEMLASVAAASITDDGDYSFEWPVATFTPWIDAARANGAYVILDLQSGRDDFLTQARMYQELLELPFVGLALDPEWRLQPDQVHLRQTGSVTAAEANQVIDWIADLVRANGLPQKMIIIHQFRHSMIQDRDTLAQRPEIQLIIQMDGEGGSGGEAQKDQTYDALTAGTEDKHWRWGWKNFFDEDEPGPPPPENVMGKDPSPVYVSYQ